MRKAIINSLMLFSLTCAIVSCRDTNTSNKQKIEQITNYDSFIHKPNDTNKIIKYHNLIKL